MRAHREHGLSLVELMVGLVLAMLIAAAAVTLLGNSLGENRRLLVEARVTQDLRSAADLVVRETRRAGHWRAAATAGIWSATAASGAQANPYIAVTPDNAASDGLAFHYSQDTTENNVVDSNDVFGFRLRAGVIEARLGDGNWQALTDPATLLVTQLRFSPRVQNVDLEVTCTSLCTDPTACVPARVQVRSVDILISARSASDAQVLRSMRSTVRLRNDSVAAGCAV